MYSDSENDHIMCVFDTFHIHEWFSKRWIFHGTSTKWTFFLLDKSSNSLGDVPACAMFDYKLEGVYIYIDTHTYMHIYIYVYICLYILYVYIYIHTLFHSMELLSPCHVSSPVSLLFGVDKIWQKAWWFQIAFFTYKKWWCKCWLAIMFSFWILWHGSTTHHIHEL